MAFWDDEESLEDGVPVELHEFQARDTSVYWRYAAAPADITYSENVYRAVHIEGSPIEQGTNALRNQTTVRMDWDCPFAAQYMVAEPEQVIDYRRYKGHGANFVCQFVGVVIAVRFRQQNREGDRYAEILIDPAANDLRESGLQLRAGRQCQVPIYSAECGLDRADWRVSGTVATVNFRIVTASLAYPVGWLSGGDFVARGARRKIVEHIGGTLRLSRDIYGLVAGDPFDAYPGCDHLTGTCHSKFSNRNNFRGDPYMPAGDPWSDTMI